MAVLREDPLAEDLGLLPDEDGGSSSSGSYTDSESEDEDKNENGVVNDDGKGADSGFGFGNGRTRVGGGGRGSTNEVVDMKRILKDARRRAKRGSKSSGATGTDAGDDRQRQQIAVQPNEHAPPPAPSPSSGGRLGALGFSGATTSALMRVGGGSQLMASLLGGPKAGEIDGHRGAGPGTGAGVEAKGGQPLSSSSSSSSS